MSKKEAVVHIYIFKNSEHHIVACQLDDSKNISLGFSLNDVQLTPLHMLNMALGQCLAELTLRFLERRSLKTSCLITIRTTVTVTGSARIEDTNIVLKLPLQLSSDDEVILIRMLHQCPIHAAITGSVSIKMQVCEDREAISQYERNILTHVQHAEKATPFTSILDYALRL